MDLVHRDGGWLFQLSAFSLGFQTSKRHRTTRSSICCRTIWYQVTQTNCSRKTSADLEMRMLWNECMWCSFPFMLKKYSTDLLGYLSMKAAKGWVKVVGNCHGMTFPLSFFISLSAPLLLHLPPTSSNSVCSPSAPSVPILRHTCTTTLHPLSD